MSAPVATDERLRALQWKDLRRLSRVERVRELTLPAPWLLASLALAHLGAWPGALACSFMLFLTGLRVSHDAQHGNLSLPRRGHDAVLFALSVMMGCSMHAVRVNHLRHHARCLGPDDFEGRAARMRWFEAVLHGPAFAVRIVVEGLRKGSVRDRRWIAAELAAGAAWGALVLGVLPFAALRYHVVAMLAGQTLTAFFAVWTVHHDCDAATLARTQRGAWKNALSYDMFRHVEHHLFPAVPTCRLSALGRRIDAVAPELAERQVL